MGIGIKVSALVGDQTLRLAGACGQAPLVGCSRSQFWTAPGNMLCEIGQLQIKAAVFMRLVGSQLKLSWLTPVRSSRRTLRMRSVRLYGADYVGGQIPL